jgi:omega-hydroxy-beta-dihydromenaquinone-9 sulfotransferase
VRPIIIVGVGRSGSTVFHHVMSGHAGVAWLSQLSDRYPGRPFLGRSLMRLINLPVLGPAIANQMDPGECYGFWDTFYPGFSTPCRDLHAGDVTNSARTRIPAALEQLTTTSRSRLLLKITGWPRIGYLNEIFPDALFIHVLRDGRPVAASFMNVPWWWGWRGPENWRWGKLSAEHQAEWDRQDRSFVALAGIQWKILMQSMEMVKPLIPSERFMEVRYEDVCAEPARFFRQAVEFAGLEWTPQFERHVSSQRLRSENEKWRKDLTPAQQGILESVLAPALQQYGYR